MAHGPDHQKHRHGYKFDVKRLERLKDPERATYLPPDTIWELLAGPHTKTVIDLGAGLGFFAIPFARKVPHGKVYACDLSAEMVGHLEQELRAAGATNVEAVKTEEVAVPLPDGIADLVFMINLHHELDHPVQTLAECRRLLAPGGRVAVIDWKPETTATGPPLEVRVPPQTVVEQMAAAGFADAAILEPLRDHYVTSALKPQASPG